MSYGKAHADTIFVAVQVNWQVRVEINIVNQGMNQAN
jgi:hypothetical protein